MTEDILEPVESDSLAIILRRSEGGESVAKIIVELGLPLMKTLESLKRFHNDDVLMAKAKQRG